MPDQTGLLTEETIRKVLSGHMQFELDIEEATAELLKLQQARPKEQAREKIVEQIATEVRRAGYGYTQRSVVEPQYSLSVANQIYDLLPDSPFETLKPEAQEAWKQDADQILSLVSDQLKAKDGEIERLNSERDDAIKGLAIWATSLRKVLDESELSCQKRVEGFYQAVLEHGISQLTPHNGKNEWKHMFTFWDKDWQALKARENIQ